MHVKRNHGGGKLRRPELIVLDRQRDTSDFCPPRYDPPRALQQQWIARWGTVDVAVEAGCSAATFRPHPLFIADLPPFVVREFTERLVYARVLRVLLALINGIDPKELER